MSDLRADINRALVCLEFVNEDDGHDAEACFWCLCFEYTGAFGGESVTDPAVSLLRRVIETLDSAAAQRAAALTALELHGSMTSAIAILKGEQ